MNHDASRSLPRNRRSAPWHLAPLLLAVTACGPAPSERAVIPAPPPPSAPSNASPASGTSTPASTASEFQRLIGRWIRLDGGYILHVRQADAATGRLDVQYLNPQPIHVAQAEATQSGGKTTVFVELQDVNYPGCTYRLTYFPATDQLYGTYYQAALQQSYDVECQRETTNVRN